MRFNELDKIMREYETNSDLCVLPGVYTVARLDGRSFTKLTKERHDFEVPFDIHFRDCMVETVEHLFNVGAKVLYGYTESDEISLLFSLGDNWFGRKLRKLNSILAGEASAKFSLLLGSIGVFDCRISQLPDTQRVIDYFLWRREDSARNSLNSYCYWTLVKSGTTPEIAAKTLLGMKLADKHELLYKHGINFAELPEWQKNGVGVYWEEYVKEGFNPVTSEKVETLRKRLVKDTQLLDGEKYIELIRNNIIS